MERRNDGTSSCRTVAFVASWCLMSVYERILQFDSCWTLTNRDKWNLIRFDVESCALPRKLRTTIDRQVVPSNLGVFATTRTANHWRLHLIKLTGRLLVWQSISADYLKASFLLSLSEKGLKERVLWTLVSDSLLTLYLLSHLEIKRLHIG